jgi:hypothetical protein
MVVSWTFAIPAKRRHELSFVNSLLCLELEDFEGFVGFAECGADAAGRALDIEDIGSRHLATLAGFEDFLLLADEVRNVDICSQSFECRARMDFLNLFKEASALSF